MRSSIAALIDAIVTPLQANRSLAAWCAKNTEYCIPVALEGEIFGGGLGGIRVRRCRKTITGVAAIHM